MWLLAVLKHCGSLKATKQRLMDLQSGFMDLLSENNGKIFLCLFGSKFCFKMIFYVTFQCIIKEEGSVMNKNIATFSLVLCCLSSVTQPSFSASQLFPIFTKPYIMVTKIK
jgi:hypothetical protein